MQFAHTYLPYKRLATYPASIHTNQRTHPKLVHVPRYLGTWFQGSYHEKKWNGLHKGYIPSPTSFHFASSQVKGYSPGEHESSAQREPQGPARWGRVVGMNAAAPAACFESPRSTPPKHACLDFSFEIPLSSALFKYILLSPARTLLSICL